MYFPKVDLTDFNKCIIRHGTGEKPLFMTNTKATFHFKTYKLPREGDDKYTYLHRIDEKELDNNARMACRPIAEPTACDEVKPRHLLDDTRAMGVDPMELLIGREFRLPIWEAMIKTMKVGEIARFSCPYEVIADYPYVSKAVRDMHWRKTGKNVKKFPPQHICSLAISYNTGHPDIDALHREHCPLVFIFELLKIEQPGNYKMEHWAMSEYEKSKAIPQLKEAGNKLYEEKEYAKAAELYFEALCYVEEQLMREKRDSPGWWSEVEKKVPLLLNYAQCKLLLKEYTEAIRQCSTVIDYKPNNVKAYFRRGKAYAAVWDEKEAKADFSKAVELDPSLAKTVDKELKSLAERLKQMDDKDKQRLKGKLFS